ncbi:MAG: helix-turn-helix transcriptional regulator [Solirubrobacterales bacterium]
MALLDRYGELTSYEIKEILGGSIEAFWPVPHTTTYQEPARLVAGGYLAAYQEKGGRRLRRYSLTDAGKMALSAWIKDPEASPPQLRDELLLKLFAGADPEPLVNARIASSEQALERLEGHLDAARLAPGWTGPERTLRIAADYQRKMIELFKEVRRDLDLLSPRAGSNEDARGGSSG